MTYIGILIVTILLIVSVFVFRGGRENTQSTMEEGLSAVEDAELLKERIENRAREQELENE